MEFLLFTCLVVILYGFVIIVVRNRRRGAYKKHMPELTTRYAVQCIADTWNVELWLSPFTSPPAICLLTEELLVVFNLETEQEDVYSLKQFLWGIYYNEPNRHGNEGIYSEMNLHFKQNQQLKIVQLRMRAHQLEKFRYCFQRIAHINIHRIHSLSTLMRNRRDVMSVEQDIHGVWQLGDECQLITTPEHMVELTGDDDTIVRIFPVRDIDKVEVIQPYDVEINGILPTAFNGIIRLYLPDEKICYATKRYIRYGLDVSGFLQVPYEHIDRKYKKK